MSKLNPERGYGDLDSLAEIVDDIRESDDRTLFIFDDMVKQIKQNVKILQEISYNARQICGSISQIYITQKLNEVNLALRSNMNYIFFWNLSNRRELDSLYTDYITALDRDEFDEIIKHIKEKNVSKHDFLYIRLNDNEFHRCFNKLSMTP
jgi:hypothetical protein